MTRQRVNAICSKVAAWIAERHSGDLAAVRAEHTGRLEVMYREAMERWRKSGDAKHLGEARKCLANIRRLWVVEKPVQREAKVEVTQNNTVAVMKALTSLPQEVICRMADSIKRGHEQEGGGVTVDRAELLEALAAPPGCGTEQFGRERQD